MQAIGTGYRVVDALICLMGRAFALVGLRGFQPEPGWDA